MKRTDIQALHDKTVAELQQQLGELRKQFTAAKLERAVGKLKDVRLTSRLSDDMARVQAVMRQKELEQNV